jgi:superfamily I DNA and/or RNA helicase
VAITRAKRHLIVLGKESLLSRNLHWRYIIDKAKLKEDKVYGYKKAEDFVKKDNGIFRQMLKEF